MLPCDQLDSSRVDSPAYVIDVAALERNLELLATTRGERRGSLLHVLDETNTPRRTSSSSSSKAFCSSRWSCKATHSHKGNAPRRRLSASAKRRASGASAARRALSVAARLLGSVALEISGGSTHRPPT